MQQNQITRIKGSPGENIGAENTANDVTQVGDVVDIRQCTGHKDVSFPLLW